MMKSIKQWETVLGVLAASPAVSANTRPPVLGGTLAPFLVSSPRFLPFGHCLTICPMSPQLRQAPVSRRQTPG